MKLKPIKKRLGDILVDVGIITPTQLQSALEIQKRGGGKLGEILSQMGAINEEVMLAFIGKQCGASFISLSEYGEIPEDIIKTIPESIARHQNLIPVSREGNILTVAMADPFNIFALDDIKVMTGHDVQVVIASEPDIRSAIKKYYYAPPLVESGAALSGTPEEQINSLLKHALAMHATEIHFEPQSDSVRLRFRIDGILHEQAPISEQTKNEISKKLKLLSGLDPVQSGVPSQGHARIKADNSDIHLKLSVIPTILGERITARILNPSLPMMDFAKLGFEPETIAVYRKNIESLSGLVLLTGPINSGKTTTLYSTLNYMNFTERNIVSIEDTVEFILPGISQIQVNQEKQFNFARAIQHAIEHKPDVLMVSELKDREAADLTMNAAIAGHMVLSSIHSAGSLEAIERLYNMGIEPYKIASALKLIVSQRLMRTICQECKASYKLGKNILHTIGVDAGDADKNSSEITLWRGTGCPACNNTGYSGQTTVYEVVVIEDKLRQMIAEKSPEQVLAEAMSTKGVLTLREASWRKVLAGLSTVEEMMRVNNDYNLRGALKC